MATIGNNLSSTTAGEGAFITMFGDEVTHIAQQKSSNLQSAVRTVRGVVGSTYRFPVLGKAGVVKNKNSATDIEVLSAMAESSGTLTLTGGGTFIGDGTGTTSEPTTFDVMAHTHKNATIDNFSTGEYVDDFDALKTNVDLRSAYAASIAGAMNRAYDKVIIDGLDAGTTGMTDIGDISSSGLSRTEMQTIHNALNAKDVPLNDRYLVVDSATYGDLLGSDFVNNADGPLSQALVTGQIANVLGFNIIMSNLLTDAGSGVMKCYAFHKDAVGMAIGKDISTMVNYVPQKLSTLIASEFSAGSVVIDPTACAYIRV